MSDHSRLPYYAVIFTSELRTDSEDYSKMAVQMKELASKQHGYLGFESTRNGLGISVSYWTDLEEVKKWKANLEHLEAQKKGRNDWYKWYHVRICKVEREYLFNSME